MLVDQTRLRALRDEVGEEGYEEVLALFLAESDAVVERLSRQSPKGQDLEGLHFLKGIALNLGFDSLAALCVAGERDDGFDPAALCRVYAETRLALESVGA